MKKNLFRIFVMEISKRMMRYDETNGFWCLNLRGQWNWNKIQRHFWKQKKKRWRIFWLKEWDQNSSELFNGNCLKIFSYSRNCNENTLRLKFPIKKNTFQTCTHFLDHEWCSKVLSTLQAESPGLCIVSWQTCCNYLRHIFCNKREWNWMLLPESLWRWHRLLPASFVDAIFLSLR